MDQKDSYSGMYKAGVAGDNAPRAVFFFLVRRSMMRGIMSGMDQMGFLVRRHPFRAAEADPHGPDYSEDHRVSPVAVRVRLSSQLLLWRNRWLLVALG